MASKVVLKIIIVLLELNGYNEIAVWYIFTKKELRIFNVLFLPEIEANSLCDSKQFTSFKIKNEFPPDIRILGSYRIPSDKIMVKLSSEERRELGVFRRKELIKNEVFEFVIEMRKHSSSHRSIVERVKFKMLVWTMLSSINKKLVAYLYWISEFSIRTIPEEFEIPMTMGKSKRVSRTYLKLYFI